MKTQSINLKKIFMIALMSFGILFTACQTEAQPSDETRTPEERAKKMTERMKAVLSLTEEQYPKVKAINLKYAQKNEQILKGSGSKLSRYKAVKSSQKEKKREMKAVLTKEQFKKYEEMLDEMEAEAKERYKNKNE